ncbi:MAG TPA: hypothetical protein VM658_21390 [bacterium]|nr:hypothetical protein [bacterium]
MSVAERPEKAAFEEKAGRLYITSRLEQNPHTIFVLAMIIFVCICGILIAIIKVLLSGELVFILLILGFAIFITGPVIAMLYVLYGNEIIMIDSEGITIHRELFKRGTDSIYKTAEIKDIIWARDSVDLRYPFALKGQTRGKLGIRADLDWFFGTFSTDVPCGSGLSNEEAEKAIVMIKEKLGLPVVLQS